MKKLYKFDVSCGRMGDLQGVFVKEEEDIKGLIGTEVYFGEVLGKHSEITIEIQAEDFTELTDDQEFISKFIELGCESGYNPFDYLEDEELEDLD